ncbi:MAG: hypothetical protein ABSA11_15725 [Candidatus Bathyarchaeia archaeon]|jgi:hypothetical protein
MDRDADAIKNLKTNRSMLIAGITLLIIGILPFFLEIRAHYI